MSFPQREPFSAARVVRRVGPGASGADDVLATEEPLEIRVREGEAEARRLLVTMRTPGDDDDLTTGVLFGEGLVDAAGEILALDRPPEARIDPDVARNVMVATLSPRAGRPGVPDRHGVVSSACGVCGRRSIEGVLRLGETGAPRPTPPGAVPASVFAGLPERLRREQEVFLATGGLHAAGLFGRDGEPFAVREDVGRHNATDKVIGALLRSGRETPPVLLVSGRIGFEISQKAARSGVAVLAAISAPTSLAVELADAAGLCLVGFLRGGSFNVYTHPERIAGL